MGPGGRSAARVQRVQGHACGVRVLKMDRPDGRRVLKFDGALGPEGCGGGFAADYKKASPPPPVISTEAKRSGEISPPLMVRAALRWEISRLRVSSERFPSAPIPTRSPARDDGVGEQHPVIKKGGRGWRHWTHLRCKGSEGSACLWQAGSKGGGIALWAMSIKSAL